jgi:hypothetical protein
MPYEFACCLQEVTHRILLRISGKTHQFSNNTVSFTWSKKEQAEIQQKNTRISCGASLVQNWKAHCNVNKLGLQILIDQLKFIT